MRRDIVFSYIFPFICHCDERPTWHGDKLVHEIVFDGFLWMELLRKFISVLNFNVGSYYVSFWRFLNDFKVFMASEVLEARVWKRKLSCQFPIIAVHLWFLKIVFSKVQCELIEFLAWIQILSCGFLELKLLKDWKL